MTPRHRIEQGLATALRALGLPDAVVLEFPSDLAHGEYATPVALALAKHAGESPRALAERIVAALPEIDGVERPEIAGPGFLNFRLTRDAFAQIVGEVDEEWGKGSSLANERVMVEYTDPNPFKEFHIGHLMSNAIGESIARLHEYGGATVVRANWQGDVGLHVAKAIWGKQTKPELPWGEAYAYGAAAYEEHKEAIDAVNQAVYEKSDPEVNRLYDEGRAESLARFEELYALLGTRFDHYFFEGLEGLAGVPLVRAHLEDGVFENSDGAVVFPGEKYGLHTRVFINSKGLPTYEAKELGLNQAKFAKEPGLTRSIIITASEQSEYFKVVLKAMSFVMPDVAAKTRHVAHGMMRFAEGKMSSRTGNVVTGESLLGELAAVARARAEESRAEDPAALASAIAVGAIKFQVLRGGAGKDIIFDREQALAVDGDSGPYLQYSYARAASLLRKAGSRGSTESPTPEVPEVERLLPRFPEVLARALSEYEPHHVTTYLIALASAFNAWYATGKVLGDAHEAYKLALVSAFGHTMKNGLSALGIPVLEKM